MEQPKGPGLIITSEVNDDDDKQRFIGIREARDRIRKDSMRTPDFTNSCDAFGNFSMNFTAFKPNRPVRHVMMSKNK